MSRALLVVILASGTVLSTAASATAAPTNTCNADHTNYWNVQIAKSKGVTPGSMASSTAHSDGGLGAVLGWFGPFLATECRR